MTPHLFTPALRKQLVANGQLRLPWPDRLQLCPVVSLGFPGRGATWLLSEIDALNPDIAWGIRRDGMHAHFEPFSLSGLARMRILGDRLRQHEWDVPRETLAYVLERWDSPH